MDFDVEAWTDSQGFPDGARLRIRQQIEHASSFYMPCGEHIKYISDKENLFEVLMKMQRYLIDSNLSDPLRDAAKPENKNKAFILGQTYTDEQDNLKAALLKWDNSNNNLFDFGYMEEPIGGFPTPCVMINRLDAHQPLTFNMEKMRLESRPHEKKLKDDPKYVVRHKKHLEAVNDLKSRILAFHLCLENLDPLPSPEFMAGCNKELIETIRHRAPSAFKDYEVAWEVATMCHAALLMEPKDNLVARKTREEFSREEGIGNPKRNLFGDTRLIQNALWLNSRIISKDGAVKRMASYLGVPGITVVEM